MTFLDLAGVLGGIISSMLIIFRLIVIPFIDHSFILLAISNLFLVKQTKFKYLFEKKQTETYASEMYSKNLPKNDVNTPEIIHLSLSDYFYLFRS